MTARHLLVCLLIGSLSQAEELSAPPPAGWSTAAPRDEIRPRFAYDPRGGPERQGSFVISADEREGLIGRWTKTYPVSGGRPHHFSVRRKVTGIGVARRTGVVRIHWRDDQDRLVTHPTIPFRGYAPGDDRPDFTSYRPGAPANAAPEYPLDGDTDVLGWTEVAGTYLAPKAATRAIVDLEFRWAPATRVEWSRVALAEVDALESRPVRLATVHFVPREARTPEERRESFAPLIAEAAAQHADLVVLPEVLTFGKNATGKNAPYTDISEPIPGPSTEFFGALARQHNLHIVPGLYERDGALIYNVAVLIGPDGSIIGKYRKVTLPRGEVEGGIMPGHDYPVFSTRFGKVGMMVCYDGFFPEVARELTNRGAEVIAWPVMGCNPLLGAARAVENHVYVVSSTHTPAGLHWMISAIYGHDGLPLAQAQDWGTVIVAEVDLARPPHWPSLGNMRAEMPRHRPLDAAGR